MTNVDTKTTAATCNWETSIFEATRALLNARTTYGKAKAREKLDQLKYERNVERYPIQTEVRDGDVHIVFPAELSGVRFNTSDMEIFVKRAIAFRKASGI